MITRRLLAVSLLLPFLVACQASKPTRHTQYLLPSGGTAEIESSPLPVSLRYEQAPTSEKIQKPNKDGLNPSPQTQPHKPLTLQSLSLIPIRSSHPNGGLRVSTSIPYPTAYAPARVSGSTVIPATPTSFSTQDVGTSLQSNPNGSITYSSTSLDGFINYGSPIRVPVVGRNGSIQIQEIPNRVLQPVFSTIKIQN